MLKSLKQDSLSTIEAIQDRSIVFLRWVVILQLALVLLCSWVAGSNISLFASASLVVCLVVYIFTKSKNKELSSNVIAVTLMGQVCLMVAAMKGHSYQIDIHMYFFALLGVLAALLSVVAIIFATVTVAIHHIVVYLLITMFVFPGESTMIRVGIHAIILLSEAMVLIWLVYIIRSVFHNMNLKSDQVNQAIQIASRSDEERFINEDEAKNEHQEFLHSITNEFTISVNTTIKEVHDMIEQSLAVFDRMSVIASDVRENSELANKASHETTSNSVNAAEHMQQVNAGIGEMAEKAQSSAERTHEASESAKNSIEIVERLSASAESISDITEVIRNIASQVNLLALNATIESARAGDAGKGFAVVAGEVKALAQQTEKATEQISESITTLTAVSNEVSENMNQIVSSTSDISIMSADIALELKGQSEKTSLICSLVDTVSSDVKGIEGNISVLSKGVEENNKKTQDVHKIFSELQNEANNLDDKAAEFIDKLKE